MSELFNSPRRLIEVDLPIRKISEHARTEKNVRKGHPWHLHIWWARRPWGACRAISLAALLPDPADPRSTEEYCQRTKEILSEGGYAGDGTRGDLHRGLIRFVGDLAQWEAGRTSWLLDAARALITAAHPSRAPTVLDPFAGYGAIPGEAARLGCEAIAGDLNPVAVLCLRTLLESVPRYRERFLNSFREGARYFRAELQRRLSSYYLS